MLTFNDQRPLFTLTVAEFAELSERIFSKFNTPINNEHNENFSIDEVTVKRV